MKICIDYYPFGMVQPSRKYSFQNQYRYGFNGKENDNEVKGEGNQQDYGMRIYDPRLGRFLSTDPITGEYSELTPYQFASNTPIAAYDLDGLEAAGMYFPSGVSAKEREAAIKGYNQSVSGFVEGFAGSAWSSIKSLALLTSTISTPESIKARGEMVHAITHPRETLKNIKAGFKQWTNALKSSDPYTRSHALGQGLEFGVELALPAKGLGAIKSMERINLATSFYQKAGFASQKAIDHMAGINFTRAVKNTILEKGTVIQQWVGEKGIGNYFTTLENGAKKNLGMSYDGRTLQQFTLTEGVKVLQSTASKLNGNAGGGTQFFSPELKNKITPLIKAP